MGDLRCNGRECRLPRKQVQRRFKELYLPPNGYYLDVADEVILVQLLDSWNQRTKTLYIPYQYEGREVRLFKYA